MFKPAAIIGSGYNPFRVGGPGLYCGEMIFEAAGKAYGDTRSRPRDVSTFLSITKDYSQGIPIADEYVPDQLCAVLKPVHTVPAEANPAGTRRRP